MPVVHANISDPQKCVRKSLALNLSTRNKLDFKPKPSLHVLLLAYRRPLDHEVLRFVKGCRLNVLEAPRTQAPSQAPGLRESLKSTVKFSSILTMA